MSESITAGGERAPKRIGRYEVRRFLGAGGFAVVYEAWDSALDAHVAVKILESNRVPDIVRERFVAEAQLLRRVDDPHVITVHDLGDLDDGRPYFVMEFADRGPLSKRMPAQAGQSDVGSLRTIIEQLGAAMHALHEAGVVHRDIKPANLLLMSSVSSADEATIIGQSILRSDERILVGDLGIAKDTDRESTEPTILGGTPNFRAPEQTQRGAEITPATDVYGATCVLWNLLTGQPAPDEHALEIQLASVPAHWREVLRRGLDPDQAQRFATASTWREACLAALGDVDDSTSFGFAAVEGADVCPYKGLAAFQPDDAGLFFGREALVDDLVHRLQSASALVVSGPSGSGKSSLVRAGLLPALAKGVIPGAQHWRVALFTPQTDALSELAFHLSRLIDDPSITADRLRDDPTGVRRIVESGPPVVLAIDQFEELFTINDEQTASEVVCVLDALTSATHSNVRVILAVRADFYDTCAHYPWLAQRINENQVLVGPMGSAELRRAIEGPARQTGLQLETGLVDTILDDAGASAGSLPLLAHALMETWIRRRGHQLTLAGYRAAGGVAGAIAQRAEETYARLSAEDQVVARDLVLQMTKPGGSGPDTRRVLAREEIPASAQPVIDTFVEARLITSGDITIELAHETLLRSWPRAAGWIDEARDDLRTRQRIDAAARDWNERDRNPDLLLHGTPLESTLDWAADHRTQLHTVSQAFLDESRNSRDLSDEVAEGERRRRRRNRRIAFTALTVLLIAAVVQSISARRNENLANEASETARTQVNRGLAATAEAQAPTDPLFAIALSAESAARSTPPTPEALGALATARTALAHQAGAPLPLSDGIAVGNMLHMDLTADGSVVILGNRDGDVSFFDVASRQMISTNNAHSKGVESIFVHDDLNVAVTGGADGQVLLWDLSMRPIVSEFFDSIDGQEVWSARISPDGSVLTAVTSDAEVAIYDFATRTQRGERFDSATDRDALRSAFNEDGSELLVGNSKGELIRIDVLRGEPIGTLTPHATNVWDLDRTADGAYVYSASNDGTVRRVDLATMQVDPDFVVGMSDAVVEMRGVEALANGRDLITGTATGHIQRWDAVTGSLIATSSASHEDRVIDGAASADGQLYISLSDDQRIRLWDLSTPGPNVGRVVIDDAGPLHGLALSTNGDRAVGTADGTVLVDAADGSGVTSLPAGSGEVWGLTYLQDGSLVAGDGQGRLTRWAEGREVARVDDAHDGRVLDIAESPSGDVIATTGTDGTIMLWDSASLDALQTIGELGTEVNGLAFAPDGELLSVDLAGRVGFWSLDGGPSRDILQLPEDALFAVDVNPAGELFAVAAGDEVIAVLDLTSGEILNRLTPLSAGASDVRFIGNDVIVGLSRGGAVLFWNARSGDQLGPITRVHDESAWRLAVDSGLGVWSTAADGQLHRLNLLDRTFACELAGDVFDTERRRTFLSDEPLQSCR